VPKYKRNREIKRNIPAARNALFVKNFKTIRPIPKEVNAVLQYARRVLSLARRVLSFAQTKS